MTLIRVTPSAPLLSVAEVKEALPAYDGVPNGIIERRVRSVTRQLEDLCGRAFGQQTFDWQPDCSAFMRQGGRHLDLPIPPLVSVTSIEFVGADGSTETFAVENYVVIGVGGFGRISLVNGASWPSAEGGAITIRFVAGYAADDHVLDQAREAVLLELTRVRNLSDIGSIRRESVEGVGSTDYDASGAGSGALARAVREALGSLWVPSV